MLQPALIRALLCFVMAAVLACEQQVPPDTGMASFGDFSIDRYEFPNTRRELPKLNVSFVEAQQSCENSGKRLCTIWEWQMACMGESKRRWPYGNTYDDSACHTAIAIQGHTSTGSAVGLSRSGAYAGCKSELGTFDMSGNLEEWVDGYHLGERGILMGGAWYTYSEYTDCTGNYSRSPHFRMRPKEKVFSAGFRCCSGPSVTEEDLKNYAEEQRIAETAAALRFSPNAENMVNLGDFEMDLYEYPNQKGAPPLVHVSWFEADELCGDLGKRLCSADEWEQGCRGAEENIWPYSDDYNAKACNTEGLAPAPAGQFEQCTNEGGAFDLSGNVWEWTAERIDLGADFGSDHERRVVRGGAWYDRDSATSCGYSKGYFAAQPQFGYRDVGFRCCRDGKTAPAPEKNLAQSVENLAFNIGSDGLAHSEKAEEPSSRTDGPVEQAAPVEREVLISKEGCPDDMVRAGAVCMDLMEYPNKPGEIPTSGVTIEEAEGLCAVQDRRLCSAEEWMYACRGPQKNRWPYGDEYERAKCNYGYTGGKGGVTPAGSFPDCASDLGLLDMSGNLWEWVSDKDTEGKSLMNGGYWNLGATYGKCNTVASADQNFRHMTVGFRCCKDPAL